MSTRQLSLILDDQRTDRLIFGPAPWSLSSNPAWFNTTSQAAQFTESRLGQPGTLSATFVGTSIAFFGTTPPIPNLQNVTVSIDGGTPFNSSYGDPNPPTYRQWYQSPVLSDGRHVITLSNIANTSFDFATVTAGPSTSFTGQTVIVDNDDPSIAYTGQWRRSQDLFNSGPFADGFAFGNSTQKTTNIGDSFTFRFSGISAAVYGVFSWANIGLIELSVSVDGSLQPVSLRVNTDTPEFVSEVGDQQNFLFQSYDFLQAGDHTLTVNVTNLVNQTFVFDYITYVPSFASLRDMPNLPVGTRTSTPVPTADSGGKKAAPIGAIVGGVIGGLAAIAFMVGLIFWSKKRKSASFNPHKPSPIKTEDGLHVVPYPAGSQEISFIPQTHLPSSSPPPTSSSFGNQGGLTRNSMYTGDSMYHSSVNHGLRNQTSTGVMSQASSQLPVPPSPGFGVSAPATNDTTPPNPNHNSNLPVNDDEPMPPSYVESTNQRGPVQVTYIIRP